MMNKLQANGLLRFYADLFPMKVFFFSESIHLPIFFHKNFFSFIFRILSSNISLSVNQKNAVDCKDILCNDTFVLFKSRVSTASWDHVATPFQRSITVTIILFRVHHLSKKECYQAEYTLRVLQLIHEGFSRAPPDKRIYLILKNKVKI